MHLQQKDPEHSRHLRNLFLCLHSGFFPNTWVYESRVGSGGPIILYYLTRNLFLKLGVPRRLVQNLAQPVSTSLKHTLPDPLEHRKDPGEPLTVSVNPNDNELGFRTFVLRRPVLHKVTLLQVCNFKLKLNLWPIVFRNLGLDLTTHRTLDFDKNSILCDPVGGCAQPWVLGVLHKANLMGLSVELLVI